MALKKQAFQFEDGEDSTDTDTSSATTSASATAGRLRFSSFLLAQPSFAINLALTKALVI